MAMQHLVQASQAMLFDREHPISRAFLDALMATKDPRDPPVAGFFRMESAETPLEFHYRYDEMKIIVGGELQVDDETGHEVIAQAGDILLFEQGSTITFQSPSVGVAFFCG